MTRSAFNPTDGPVVIDDEGHVLPGLEHGDVDSDAAEVQAAVEQGRLILADDEPEPPAPAQAPSPGDELKPPAKKATATTPKEN
jgi:hypothetical protein